jgi:hypothetical protein
LSTRPARGKLKKDTTMVTKVEKVVYQAHATSTGGRDGITRSSDGLLDVKLSVPKEMGGPAAASIRNSCLPRATAPVSSAQ